ncbi:hypothetical protein [Microbulbifer guangxiensis]|uniref:hypothetical protein n=1 Tax=Microbulbifer guangxiensis TaxID=2904249 RepID=UPI001F48F6FF|nr:hypothetical protein [Microbulbifer guangxiensis]
MKMCLRVIAGLTSFFIAGVVFANPTAARAENVIDVMAVDYAFGAPTEIPSGWTTFRMKNVGSEVHVMSLARLPETVSLAEIRKLNNAYASDQRRMHRGEIISEKALELWEAMEPAWWPRIEMHGGVGFISPGQVGETTVYLQPGLYELTCHIKTADGKSHFIMGMRAHIRVTPQASGMQEPETDVRLTVSRDGLELQGEISRGEQLVEVHYADSPDPLHDIHLARLDENDSQAKAVAWMDAVQAPAPVTMLGGVGHLSAGKSGYFDANYTPGSYLFLCQQHPEERLLVEIPQ